MADNVMRTTRLEAFSDGVIAVIITIMVLELRVPHEDGFAGVLAVLPKLGLYLLSFMLVAIYWINHHELVRRVESIDSRVLWSNLLFLFVLSLLPFFTDYVGEKHFQPVPTALYSLIVLLTAHTFYVLRLSVVSVQKRNGTLQAQDRKESTKHAVCIGLDTIAIGVAFYKPWISFAINLGIALIWIVPGIGTKAIVNCPAEQPLAPRDTLERA